MHFVQLIHEQCQPLCHWLICRCVNNREGRGRPEKLFSLSQAALGDNLAVLVDALLNEKIDPEKIGKAIAQSQGLRDLLVIQPMTKRLALLVDKLNEMNYQSHW